MATFVYSACDGEGRPQNGTVVASNASQLAEDLRRRGWLVLSLRSDAQPAAAAESDLAWQRAFERSPRRIDIEMGLRQLALMERSGLSLLQALRAAAENSRRKSVARVWSDVAHRIEGGSTFRDALAMHPKQFPTLVVELASAGEFSGSLGQALERSADHLERGRAIRASFYQALFYPSIVVTLALAVGLFMVLKVVPVLEGFLKGSGRSLPWMTRVLVETSHITREYAPAFLIGLGVLIALIFVLERHPPSRRVMDRMLYRLPFVGTLRVLSGTALVARSLSVLLENGIDIVKALALCGGMLTRPVASESIANARARILAGENLAAGLTGSPAFAVILPKMIDVGERSGTLDRVLSDVAKFHEAELAAWIRRAGAVIEPIVTVVVGAIVGFVYIAFFTAMFAAAGAVS